MQQQRGLEEGEKSQDKKVSEIGFAFLQPYFATKYRKKWNIF